MLSMPPERLPHPDVAAGAERAPKLAGNGTSAMLTRFPVLRA